MERSRIRLIILIIIILSPAFIQAQSCPKGVRYNCVWGCGRHTDLNKDGFCDYSFVTQPEQKVAEESGGKDTTSVVAAADTTKKAGPEESGGVQNVVGKQSQSQSGSEKGGVFKEHVDPKNSAVQARSDESPVDGESPSGVVVIPPQASEFIPTHEDPVYDLILVTAITLLLYFTTLILYRENIIKRIHHRKLWNLLLLLTFLVSCLFGLFLVIQINYHIAMGVYGTLLYWHVEIGIAMTLIAIIHILWHLTYFKNMLKKW